MRYIGQGVPRLCALSFFLIRQLSTLNPLLVGRPSPSRVVHENNDSLDPPTPPPRSPSTELKNNILFDLSHPPPQSPSTVHEKNDRSLWPDPPSPPPQTPHAVLEHNPQRLSPSPTVSTTKSCGSPTGAGISPEPTSPSQSSVDRLRQIRRSILAKCKAVGRFSVRPPSE